MAEVQLEPANTKRIPEGGDDDLDTVDTSYRYIAYPLALLRATARTARQFVRYSAYASDVGESFRPVVHTNLVRLTYAISWVYVFGDVAWEGYKSHAHRKEEPKTVAAVVIERTVFQSVASILLPMVIIHTQVSLFQKLLANAKSPAVKKWGPTGAGFAIIPFLPLIDEPVEYCLEQAKEKIFGIPSAHPHHHPNPLMPSEHEHEHHNIEHHNKEKHE